MVVSGMAIVQHGLGEFYIQPHKIHNPIYCASRVLERQKNTQNILLPKQNKQTR